MAHLHLPWLLITNHRLTCRNHKDSIENHKFAILCCKHNWATAPPPSSVDNLWVTNKPIFGVSRELRQDCQRFITVWTYCICKQHNITRSNSVLTLSPKFLQHDTGRHIHIASEFLCLRAEILHHRQIWRIKNQKSFTGTELYESSSFAEQNSTVCDWWIKFKVWPVLAYGVKSQLQ